MKSQRICWSEQTWALAHSTLRYIQTHKSQPRPWRKRLTSRLSQRASCRTSIGHLWTITIKLRPNLRRKAWFSTSMPISTIGSLWENVTASLRHTIKSLVRESQSEAVPASYSNRTKKSCKNFLSSRSRMLSVTLNIQTRRFSKPCLIRYQQPRKRSLRARVLPTNLYLSWSHLNNRSQ
jgi:hypothetical protein